MGSRSRRRRRRPKSRAQRKRRKRRPRARPRTGAKTKPRDAARPRRHRPSPPTRAVYELYYAPGNANLAPHFVLEEVGAKFRLTLVDRANDAQHSLEYLKLNPNGRIP